MYGESTEWFFRHHGELGHWDFPFLEKKTGLRLDGQCLYVRFPDYPSAALSAKDFVRTVEEANQCLPNLGEINALNRMGFDLVQSLWEGNPKLVQDITEHPSNQQTSIAVSRIFMAQKNGLEWQIGSWDRDDSYRIPRRGKLTVLWWDAALNVALSEMRADLNVNETESLKRFPLFPAPQWMSKKLMQTASHLQAHGWQEPTGMH